MKLDRKKGFILLCAIMLIQCWCYNYFKYINMEPRSVHSWRQADCLSFAQCFYNNTSTVMETKVNNLGVTGTGKVASDFPAIQILVAKIWKLTGIKPIVFRLINLFFLLLGLFYSYRLFVLFSGKNYLLSVLLTALFFTSPILSYYGPTFLSDIHAFGLSICSFYYFMEWLEDGKRKTLIISIILFSIAGLFKMSSAFIYAIAIAFYFIRLITQKNNAIRFQIKDVLLSCTLLAIPFIPWTLWYSHANAYNNANPNGFFLIGILPFWEMPPEKAKEVLSSLVFYIIPQMMNPLIFWTLLLSFISIVFLSIKKLFNETVLRLFTLFCIFSGFTILFYQVFDVHDYYMLNMINVLIITTAVLLNYLTNNDVVVIYKRSLITIVGVLALVFTYSTAIKTRIRIDYQDVWGTKELVFNKAERDNMEYNTWYDRTRYSVLEDKSINWEKIGIGKNEIVFCIGDHTINRSLYLLNRRGFTSFNTGLGGIDNFIEDKKKTCELKYIILMEPDWKQNPLLMKYSNKPIFVKDNITVYKLD